MQPNVQKLTGAAAVGTAVVVWATHGGDWSLEEIAALSAGAGSALAYVVKLVERFIPAVDGE